MSGLSVETMMHILTMEKPTIRADSQWICCMRSASCTTNSVVSLGANGASE